MAKVIRRFAQIVNLAVGVVLICGSLWAQSDRATITGEVTDSSGSVITGVSVTATNVATNLRTTVVTNSSGNYTIPLLRPGTYDISAEQTGFKKYLHSGVVIEVGQVLSLDIPLEIGAKTETVHVTAQVVQLEKDTSERGAVVGGRDVIELPILGQGEQRNPGYFMTLVPGVTGRGISGGGSPRMLNTTVNGSQSASNEFHLDGALIGSAAEWAGDFRNIPFPQDAVGEFKVITLNPPAEFGRTGQGITSFILKSGANQFHGSAYEFVRNCTPTDPATPGDSHFCLNSRGFYAPKSDIFKQNEFGATAGGPIRKDKTFFFGWYQVFRLRMGSINFTDTVPTAAMRGGDLSNILDTSKVLGTDVLGRPVYQGEIYDPATARTVN